MNNLREIEISSRRPMVDGVLHPDDCDEITIGGVVWYVRPLYAQGSTRIVPTFGETVTLEVRSVENGERNELADLAERLRDEAPIHELDNCPTCGHARGSEMVIDLQDDLDFISLIVDYTGRLLLQQYDLTGEQLGELFAFSADDGIPNWFIGALRHAMQLSPDEMAEIDDKAAAIKEAIELAESDKSDEPDEPKEV